MSAPTSTPRMESAPELDRGSATSEGTRPAKRAGARTDLLWWLWLALPFGIVALQLFDRVQGDRYRSWLHSEYGLVENLTAIFLLIAVITAVQLYRLRQRVASPLFGPFILTMAVGCFFFGGEELSWGQHWFGFEPPVFIAQRNDQGEFNLHNDPVLDDVLDQIPRGILTFAAFVGGICAPLIRGRRGDQPRFDRKLKGWVWPTISALPAAFMAVVITLPNKIFATMKVEVPYILEFSPGETKEFCLALFLLIYLQTLYLNLRGR